MQYVVVTGAPYGKGGFAQQGFGFGQQAVMLGGGGGILAAGDWRCPNCGDNQFAKNVQCRKCATPKPQVASNRQVAKLGDWICPNPECQDVQFAKNATCRKCGTAKPDGVPDPVLPAKKDPPAFAGLAAGVGEKPPKPEFPQEDWTCVDCGELCFGRSLACRKCGSPKPVTSTNNQAAKKGDWICPNKACRDVQFEKNWACRRCGTPKPLDIARKQALSGSPAEVATNGEAKPMAEGDWMCGDCGDHQFARNLMCRKCGAPKPKVASNQQVAKKGDWICPNPGCNDVQFEKNMMCRRCGTPRPIPGAMGMGQAMIPGAAPGTMILQMPGGAAGGKYPIKPGDWVCPNAACQDIQFEKNTMCRKCGTAKPANAGKGAMGAMGAMGGMSLMGGMGAMGAMGMGTMAFPGAIPGAAPGTVLVMAGGAAGMGKYPIKPGDWVCPNPACGDIQFERNAACRKCGTDKPVISSNKQMLKPGDWICPNPECKDVQFGKNALCRKCGTAKPDDGGAGALGTAADRLRSRSPHMMMG